MVGADEDFAGGCVGGFIEAGCVMGASDITDEGAAACAAAVGVGLAISVVGGDDAVGMTLGTVVSVETEVMGAK